MERLQVGQHDLLAPSRMNDRSFGLSRALLDASLLRLFGVGIEPRRITALTRMTTEKTIDSAAPAAEPHPLDGLPPLPGFLNWPDRLLSRIEDGALSIAAVALTITMFVIVIDVCLRYLFNSPLQWSYEVVSDYLIPFAVFLAMASTLRRGEHVEVDFFVRLVTPRVRFWFRRINALIAALVFLLLVGVVGQEALRAMQVWEMSVGNYTLPLWLSKLSVPLGLGLLTIRILIQIVGDSRARELR